MTTGSNQSKDAHRFWWPIVGLTVLATYWRLQGVDPPSLRLDDQWLAILVTKLSVGDFLQFRPPVPAGFAAVQALLARVWSDPEWPLQVIPLAAGVLQLPLMAWLGLRLTGRPSLAFLGMVLLLLNPNIAQYAVTPKHYTVDSLVTVGLISIGLPLLSCWTTKRAMAIAMAGLISPLFSFPSTFVSLAIVNAASVVALTQRELRLRAVAWWAGFHAALGLVYWFLLRTQSNDAMQSYWSSHFLGSDPSSTGGGEAPTTSWSAVTEAFPVPLHSLAFVAVVGLLLCFVDRKRYPIGLCLSLFFGGVLLAATLEIYPLGTGRTDIYSYPISILAVLLAAEWLFRVPRLRAVAGGVVFALSTALLILIGAESRYEEGEDALLVRLLSERVRAEDLVVIYPHAEFAVGYYSDWPFQPGPSLVYAHGFELVFDRGNTLKLPPPDRTQEYPLVVNSLLSGFLPRGERVYYIATHIFPRGHEFVQSVLENQGLEPVWRVARPRGELICYERRRR